MLRATPRYSRLTYSGPYLVPQNMQITCFFILLGRGHFNWAHGHPQWQEKQARSRLTFSL